MLIRMCMCMCNFSIHDGCIISNSVLLAHCSHSACRYVYTPEDIQRMVEDKRARGQASNQAMHKARLLQQLQHAKDTENEALAAQCAPSQLFGGCLAAYHQQ